ELAALLMSVMLLVRWWRGTVSAKAVAIVYGLALWWHPVSDDLWSGSVNALLLLLSLIAWLSLREGRESRGGTAIGLLIAIKLFAWPVVVFLAFQRRWRAVLAAASVAALGNLLAMAAMGWRRVIEYYTTTGPSVSALYRSHSCNYSAWAWGQRLFGGFHV